AAAPDAGDARRAAGGRARAGATLGPALADLRSPAPGAHPVAAAARGRDRQRLDGRAEPGRLVAGAGAAGAAGRRARTGARGIQRAAVRWGGNAFLSFSALRLRG